MAERDRDESGRPSSTRPRDALGRPLPKAVQAFYHSGRPQLSPAETLAFAQDLLDRGPRIQCARGARGPWKNCPANERMLWQGLAQLMVGITHVQRGNVKGAIRSASSRVGPLSPDGGGAVCRRRRRLGQLRRRADRRPRSGDKITPERLRPRLVVVPTPIAWARCRVSATADATATQSCLWG